MERFTRRDLIFAASLLIGFIAISYYAIQTVSFLFEPLFLGSILALAFYPVFRLLHRSLRFSRDVASLLLTLLVGFILVVPVVFVVFLVVSEASALLDRVKPVTAASQYDFATFLRENPGFNRLMQMIGVQPEELSRQLGESIKSITDFVFKMAGSAILALPKLVFNFLIMLLTMFFAFRDGGRFVRLVRDFIPLPEDTKDRIFKRFVDTTYAVLIGMVGTSLYQSVAMTIGFLFFGVPYAFLLGFGGFLMSLLGLSPLVWVPAVLYVILIKENLVAGLILLIYCVVFVATVDNFLRPYLISRRIMLHPLPLVIFIFGGLLKFGFIGLFIGPIILALFLTSAELVREKYFPAEPSRAPVPPKA
jgi:predicted PurR-regulated permease PerM